VDENLSFALSDLGPTTMGRYAPGTPWSGPSIEINRSLVSANVPRGVVRLLDLRPRGQVALWHEALHHAGADDHMSHADVGRLAFTMWWVSSGALPGTNVVVRFAVDRPRLLDGHLVVPRTWTDDRIAVLIAREYVGMESTAPDGVILAILEKARQTVRSFRA
jgi:hypothetical protein